MTPSTLASRNGTHATPDFEVPAKARRRKLPASYKLRIVCEADGCKQGEVGALLRREGLYSSQLATWRRQRQDGSLTALETGASRLPAFVGAYAPWNRLDNSRRFALLPSDSGAHWATSWATKQIATGRDNTPIWRRASHTTYKRKFYVTILSCHTRKRHLR